MNSITHQSAPHPRASARVKKSNREEREEREDHLISPRVFWAGDSL
jgi:hypothetical protein